MSLTSILNSPSRANLAAWFKHHFPNDTATEPRPVLVGKDAHTKLDYSRIGTGFDYLFRFQLERLNPKHRQERRKWIAEHGLELVVVAQNRYVESGRGASNPNQTTRLVDDFAEAQRNYRAFVSDGILTTDLIRSSLFLAKLDVVYRTGLTRWIFRDESETEEAEVRHLEKLFLAVDWTRFAAKHQCVLNPTFGRAGALVGGADADVIIDGVLIDVKVTEAPTLQRRQLNQLLGYYLLSLMHTKGCTPVYPIHAIALYFPRADYLFELPVARYYDSTEFRQRKVEFIGLVRDRNLDLLDWENNEYLFTDYSSVKYRVDRHDFKCPYCRADEHSIKAAGETSTGRYRYRCTSCKKGFSTSFPSGRSIESVISRRLFEYRLDYEERECLEKEVYSHEKR